MNKKLFLMWFFSVLFASSACFSEEQDLEKLLAEASQGSHYQAVSIEEMSSAEALFEKVLQGDISTELQNLWKKLGYEMIVSVNPKGNTIVLKELNDYKFGRGLYWVNLALPKQYALETPHIPSDQLTREISFQLIAEGKFFAAAWNTVRRSYDEDGQVIDADMAHLKKSYLMAFSRALAKQFPEGKIIQLHGFSDNKRKTETGNVADMIVSSSSENPSSWVLKYASCMKDLSSHLIFVYPNEITELGGTTNSIALDLQGKGYFGFVHIEMSKEFRGDMVSSKVLRNSFLACMPED
jgi:hypothetical protein